MYLPRIGPASPYDPAARQAQRPQGLLGPVSSFQPAQIDQGLLSQGMQTQAPRQDNSDDLRATMRAMVKKAVAAAMTGDPAAAAAVGNSSGGDGISGGASAPTPAPPTIGSTPFPDFISRPVNNALNSILPPQMIESLRQNVNAYLPNQQVQNFQSWFNANLNPNNIFRR